MRSVALVAVLSGLSGAGLAGCASGDIDLDEEWGMSGPLSPTPPPGKEDSELRRGLPVASDTTRTQVWIARNRWEDTDTPAARAAGLAWPADSGLTWDAKFSRWIASLAWTPSVDGYSTTWRAWSEDESCPQRAIAVESRRRRPPRRIARSPRRHA